MDAFAQVASSPLAGTAPPIDMSVYGLFMQADWVVKAVMIALLLASSFSAYGLIRKLVAVEAVVGLVAETVLLLPLALGYLLWAALSGHAAFGSSPFMSGWLMLGGFVTGIPLALFAYGARLIPYSTVGLIQYLGPTLQFACGVFVLGETFDRTRLVGFALIWLSLVLFASEGWLPWLTRRRPDPGPETAPR